MVTNANEFGNAQSNVRAKHAKICQLGQYRKRL
jgi:hypothetical protein